MEVLDTDSLAHRSPVAADPDDVLFSQWPEPAAARWPEVPPRRSEPAAREPLGDPLADSWFK